MGTSSRQERVERLFPSLPKYKEPTLSSRIRNRSNRAASATLLTTVVVVLFVCAHAKEVKPRLARKDRKFGDEERERKTARKHAHVEWKRHRNSEKNPSQPTEDIEKRAAASNEEGESIFRPTEGGRDRMKRDVQYYARRVGLECETIDVQTEDGFILDLWHIYHPTKAQDDSQDTSTQTKKYPVLMIHGLLQSSGAYTCTDDHSLAFYLAKSGFDVYLGNNRCGFKPRHTTLKRSDPRMWAWNIREMATLDLPALVDCILSRTGFPKLALVGHSQGTSQTLIALSKDFVPDLGKKISVACLLAPAAYSGSLLEHPDWFFKTLIHMPPRLWRIVVGKEAFLQPMIAMLEHMPKRVVGALGYPLFHYLFQWSDKNWDRALRGRSFLWSPTLVSSEHMRWWIGRDGFPAQRCILNTRAEAEAEAEDDRIIEEARRAGTTSENARYQEAVARLTADPWFDERVPPLAMWIAECDELVDGKRLLRRFENGREPHAKVVHASVIEDYEHLDVIWAVDAIERVGKELLDVITKTMYTDDHEKEIPVDASKEVVAGTR